MKYLLLAVSLLFTSPLFAMTIIVDKASQMLNVIDDNDAIIFTTKVIIGRDDRRTPSFDDYISHIVTSPTWNVPYNLAQKDILPKIRNNPAVLTSYGYRILNSSGRNVTAAFRADNYRMQKGWRIQQAPGPGNSLGKVKFMVAGHMKNGPAIYLHGTPNYGLFANEERRFSSGCIRVYDQVDLAALLGVKFEGFKATEKWHKLPTPVRVIVR